MLVIGMPFFTDTVLLPLWLRNDRQGFIFGIMEHNRLLYIVLKLLQVKFQSKTSRSIYHIIPLNIFIEYKFQYSIKNAVCSNLQFISIFIQNFYRLAFNIDFRKYARKLHFRPISGFGIQAFRIPVKFYVNLCTICNVYDISVMYIRPVSSSQPKKIQCKDIAQIFSFCIFRVTGLFCSHGNRHRFFRLRIRLRRLLFR